MFEHFMPRRGKKRSKQSRGARPFERNHWLPAGRSSSPVIELLEMRALLSAVSVTDLNDDGSSNSLRAAFNTATGGETMTLSAGTYSLTQGELNIGTISGTLTIVGQTTASGAPATIIDQLSLDRVIQIAAGASVTFENIEITGGTAINDDAGGTDQAQGGGILFGGAADAQTGLPLANAGTLTLTNVLVTGNKALATSPGQAAMGGGIDSTGTLIIGGGSVVEGNSAIGATTSSNGNNTNPNGSAYGGGIFSGSAGQFTVTDSTIADNTALGGSSQSAFFGLGGGIYISNTGTAASVLTDDVITGNQAVGGQAGSGSQGGFGVGGGIEVDKGGGNSIATGAPVTITNTTFAYNIAQGGAGGSATGGDAYGGAGDLNTGGSVLLNDTFYGNTALGGTGAVSGSGFGGGIEDDTAYDPDPGNDTITEGLTIINVTFASNIAQGGAFSSTSGTGTGGGLGNDSFNPDSSLVVENTIIAGNTAATAPDLYNAVPATGPPVTVTADHDLIGDGTGATGLTGSGNQVGTSGSPINPKLGQLQNNGGNTATAALLAGSPAIDAGDNAAATAALNAAGLPSTDQRGTGFSRIVNGTVDIGAYEVQTTQATTTTLSPITSPINVGQSVTLTATVTATGTPTGVVTFWDTINGTTTNLGTAVPATGVATLQVLALPVGTNSITAAYSGDTTFSGSISTAKSEVVNLPSGLALAASATIADSAAGYDSSTANNSLRSAIAAANANTGTSGETIVLSAGTYLLTQAELAVTNTAGPLTIIGQGSTGPNATIIDQSFFDRVFQINVGASVTFENVEITGGVADTDASDDTNNVTTADLAIGGGILAGDPNVAGNNGTLTLTNVAVENNKSLALPGGGTGVSAYGGGVLSTGNLTIGGGSVISDNSAVGAAGGTGTGSGGGAAGGGGVFWLSSGSATISGTTVAGNVIEAGAGDGVAGTGGLASGGGVYISNSGTGLASLSNDTVTGNESLGGVGASGTSNGNSAFGGGVFSNGSGPIQIAGTTVANNTAIAGAGAAGESGTNGDDGVAGDGDNGGVGVAGGVYISNSGPTAPTLTGVIITNNTVHGGAGGAGASGSGIKGGTGGVVFGGGLLITQNSGAIPVSSSLIANNTAQGGAGGAAGTGGTAGDGGDAAGGGFLTAATGTQLLDSTVFGNTVTGGSGHNAGNAFGGGVEDETGFGAPDTGMSLVNVTVVSNTAQAGTQSGGTSGSAFGGGIDNDDKLVFGGNVIAADTALVVTNTLVAENKTEDHTGAEVEANGPDVFGAASTADHNLVGDGTGASGFTAAGNQVGTSGSPINPKVGPLQPNGGNSQTLALLTGSPALAAGDPTAATAALKAADLPSNDQRGLPRIVAGKTDIGAFETQAAVAAPVVTASGTVNTVTVGGTAVAVDSGITVSSSDVDLTGAKVTISSGTLQTGDSLHFTTQNGITGNFSAGVLTLSGSATPAQYQTALRSVTFSTTSTNTTARAMSVVALDNALTSNSAAESVKVAIGAPVVTPSGATSKFTVGGAAVAVDASLTVSSFDVDLTGAKLTISSGTLQSGDTLHFTTQNGISGNFSGGVLTLSGSATVANYQTALRSVTFSTTSNSSVTRSLAIVALDNSLTSDPATESVTIITAPIVTASGTVNVFTLDGTAVAVDSGITVASNDTDLTGATVTISPSTLQTGDTLHFNTQNGITGSFSAGVLTLSGNATPAQYQTALQSVTFSTSGSNITTRTVSVVALDNSLTSNTAAESVKVAVVAPVVTASGATSTFTVGGSAVPVDAGVTVTSDDADLTGATMTISSGTLQTGDTLHFTTQNGISGSFSGGVLTLSGSATPTQYQTALQSVTFSTTSNSPVTRSVSIVALDNSATSNSVAKSVKVIAAPVVTASGATNTFTVGGTAVAVDSAIAVSSNDTDLTGATVTISPSTLQTGDTLNFNTQNGITGNFSAGVLTLSGSATPAQYQTALQSVTFSSTSTNSTTRAISVVAVDNALTSSSAAESVKVAFAPPVLTASGATNTFTVGGTAVAVDSGVTVTSDDTDLTGATMTISSGTLQSGDVLSFTTQNGISGNFSGGVLTLSGSATPAQYQTALQSVTFSTTSNSPVARSVSIVALDNALTSNSVTKSVKIIAAPVVTASGATNTFTVGGTAVAVDSAITVTSNDTDLTGATLTISSGTLQTGDTLNFSTQNGITGSFSGGVLTLSGSATVANYQTALQSVTFSTTSTNATTRAIAVVALDNALTSTSAAESVQVTAATASLSGTAYDDVNQQGTFDTSEATLDNITITLTGTDSSGNAVNQTAQTSASGTYTFSSLVAGTYSLAATMPTDLMAGTATAGNDGGTAAGETVNSITLAAGAAGTGYNFGAYGLAPQFISINLFLASTPSNSELLNQEPTISTLADQTVNPGASTPATPFTVSDPLASAASLTVSGTSSNTTLVPNANIVYAGSGADRTVTVTPAAGQTGTATITTTVSDSYGSQSNAGFKLNVAANPVVTPSSAANTFTTGGSAVAVDSGVTVSSSDTDLTGATVTISSDTLQSSDLLNFVNQNGITGNYTAGMLTLSGSATPAQYQAALQSVTFSTTSTSTTTRSLSIVALDNALTSNSAAESVQVSTGSTPAVTSASLAQSATDAALAGEDDWTS